MSITELVEVSSGSTSVQVDDRKSDVDVSTQVGGTGPAGPPGAGDDRGWGFHRQDAAVALAAGVRTRLTQDGSDSTRTDYQDATRARWNPTSGKIEGADLERNWTIISISMTLTAVVAERQVTADLDIGGAFGVISSASQRTTRSAGVPEQLTFSFTVFTGATFLANGAEVHVTCDGAASVSEVGVAVFQ